MTEESNKKQFTINTVIVLIIGFFVLIWVGLQIAFPTFRYELINVGVSKVGMLKQEIGGKYYFVITPQYDYPYAKVELALKSRESYKNVPDSLVVLKDYVSQAYPKSDQTLKQSDLKNLIFENNQTDTPNGTLFSYNEAVYFLSGGKARAFLGPEIFQRLGYDWKEVIKMEGDQFILYEKGDKLNFTSAHPNGTLLRTKDGEILLVKNQQRLPIDKQSNLEKVWPGYHSVKVDQAAAIKLGNCQNRLVKNGDIKCSIKVEKEFQSDGGSYLFEVPQGIFDATTFSRVNLSMMGNFDLTTAKESIKRVKDSLYLRYSQYIF